VKTGLKTDHLNHQYVYIEPDGVEHRFSYFLSDDEIDKMISELRVKYRDDKLEALKNNRLYQLYSVSSEPTTTTGFFALENEMNYNIHYVK
jgi:hypothetical protein